MEKMFADVKDRTQPVRSHQYEEHRNEIYTHRIWLKGI
jgi:hypothetical protein